MSLNKISLLVVLICLGIAPLLHAEENCFEKHLQEAIQINENRKPKYAALSDGMSEKVSDKLIHMENLLLPVARYLDRKALPFNEKGLRVLCDEFVPMDRIAPLHESVGKPEKRPEILENYSGWKLMLRFWRMSLDNMTEIQDLTEKELKALEDHPNFLCMTRHFLESMRRIAYFAVRHDQQASQSGVPSPLKISKRVMQLHILGLPLAAKLDRLAAPVQEIGIPLICGDVPAITLEELSPNLGGSSAKELRAF